MFSQRKSRVYRGESRLVGLVNLHIPIFLEKDGPVYQHTIIVLKKYGPPYLNTLASLSGTLQSLGHI